MWYVARVTRSRFLRICILIASLIAPIAAGAMQNQTDAARDAARKQFQTHCSRCHGADGNGGEMGPPIVTGIVARSDAELMTVIRDGRPANGMPRSAPRSPTAT
jgi:mono/diheme cytochrome c family protein